MCGGCGVAQQDWAVPILSSAYAKPLVARLLTGLAPGLSVRATGVGWTMTQPGRPVTVHTSGAALLDQVSGWMVSRGVPASAVTATLDAAPEHRELRVTREMFPAVRTQAVPVSPDTAAGGAEPVAPSRLIPGLLGTALVTRMTGATASSSLLVRDDLELWRLRVD